LDPSVTYYTEIIFNFSVNVDRLQPCGSQRVSWELDHPCSSRQINMVKDATLWDTHKIRKHLPTKLFQQTVLCSLQTGGTPLVNKFLNSILCNTL